MRVISLDSMATSVPVPMVMPRSACTNAEASFGDDQHDGAVDLGPDAVADDRLERRHRGQRVVLGPDGIGDGPADEIFAVGLDAPSHCEDVVAAAGTEGTMSVSVI